MTLSIGSHLRELPDGIRICEICDRTFKSDAGPCDLFICADCWREHNDDVAEEERHRKALAAADEAKAIADALAQDEATEAMPSDPPDFWRTVVSCASCNATAPALPTDPFFLSFGVCCDKNIPIEKERS